MKFKLYLVLLVVVFITNINAQSSSPPHNHDHHENEFGIANTVVFFVNEKEFAYGLHLHYIRNISASKFGIGLGYERIFDEHKHNTLGIIASYRPIERLNFNISPGLTFEDSESEIDFTIHSETSYEFEINDFHIGPIVGLAYEPNEIHISVGLHAGYGF